MCGILGKIDYSCCTDWYTGLFVQALNLQEHRGPDDSGMQIGDRYIFGHRRLSIIDLDSHAKQPMQSADGMEYWFLMVRYIITKNCTTI